MDTTVRSDSGEPLGQRFSDLAKVKPLRERFSDLAKDFGVNPRITLSQKEQERIFWMTRARRSIYTTNAGAKASISKGPETPLLSKHQKLKHLVAELPTLVDNLTQDCCEHEKSLISLRTSMESEKAEKEIWQQLYKQHKREKEELLKKIRELERELVGKQILEIEIQELKGKLEVMKHLEGGDDAAVQHKMDLMMQLKQQAKEFDELQEFNLKLIEHESKKNDELQEARKELITGFSNMLSSNRVSIGIKRMGELDEKPFKKACKTRFPPDKAEIKAAELCALWEEELIESEWLPTPNH